MQVLPHLIVPATFVILVRPCDIIGLPHSHLMFPLYSHCSSYFSSLGSPLRQQSMPHLPPFFSWFVTAAASRSSLILISLFYWLLFLLILPSWSATASRFYRTWSFPWRLFKLLLFAWSATASATASYWSSFCWLFHWLLFYPRFFSWYTTVTSFISLIYKLLMLLLLFFSPQSVTATRSAQILPFLTTTLASVPSNFISRDMPLRNLYPPSSTASPVSATFFLYA